MPRDWHRSYEATYYSRPDVKARRAAQMRFYRSKPEAALKNSARRKVRHEIEMGRLIRQPCACGSMKSQAHHADYSKPLDVIWLCPPCHATEHAKAKGTT